MLPRDVEIDLASSLARPGFQMSYYIRVDHLTAGGTGNITITLDFDRGAFVRERNACPNPPGKRRHPLITTASPNKKLPIASPRQYLRSVLRGNVAPD